MGPHPLSVLPLGGAKGFFSNAIFSVTAADIGTVLSLLCAPYGCPYSAPTGWGPGPPIWGSVLPKWKFTSGDPEIFCLDCFFSKFADRQRKWCSFDLAYCRTLGDPLAGKNVGSKILGAWHFFNLRHLWRHLAQI